MSFLKIRHVIASTLLLAAALVAAGHMYRHVAALRAGTSVPSGTGRSFAVAVPFDLAVPTGSGYAPSEPDGGRKNDDARRPTPAPTAEHPPVSRARSPEKPATRTPKASSIDLSAYEVQAKRASGRDYLPDDESMTPDQIKEAVSHRESGTEDWGRGVVGDVIRGAQKIVREADDATLDASRKALRTLASPDHAKIRPDSDGVRLHINIPTN